MQSASKKQSARCLEHRRPTNIEILTGTRDRKEEGKKMQINFLRSRCDSFFASLFAKILCKGRKTFLSNRENVYLVLSNLALFLSFCSGKKKVVSIDDCKYRSQERKSKRVYFLEALWRRKLPKQEKKKTSISRARAAEKKVGQTEIYVWSKGRFFRKLSRFSSVVALGVNRETRYGAQLTKDGL